jgi:DNA-binding GntR family transcriptional regulator
MAKSVDHACDVLRGQILSGKYAPGERLREEELTTLTGVSRTPVREALRQLAKEGFVVIESNRGASIPVYSSKDIDEIYGLRTLLESHAARRAAGRITPKQIDELERINEEFRALVKMIGKGESSTELFLKMTGLNQDFHKVIMDASDNHQLSEIVNQLARNSLSARTFAHYSVNGQKRSAEGHDEIIRALRAGHADWAEAAMRSHVHYAREVITEVYKENAEKTVLKAV